MSENQDSTSSGINSVAGRLKASKFKETSIARAVREYIESLLWIRSDIGPNLSKAIWDANAAHRAVLEKEIVWVPSIEVK